jgi:asparagine synthase (glutamine-hydrolysing)
MNPIRPAVGLAEGGRAPAIRDGPQLADIASLRDEMVAAVERNTRGESAASVLFSGGIDSSIVASLAIQRMRVELVVIGFPDSPDVRGAEDGAARLGVPLTRRLLEASDLHEAVVRYGPQLEGLPWVERSVLLATALGIEATKFPLVLCGQGADELFLGYAHYRGLLGTDLQHRQRLDLGRLSDAIWPRSRALAAMQGKRLESPYLDPLLVARVLRTPMQWRQPTDLSKELLRAVGQLERLPPAITRRPKRALQYGSRVDRELRRNHRAQSPKS